MLNIIVRLQESVCKRKKSRNYKKKFPQKTFLLKNKKHNLVADFIYTYSLKLLFVQVKSKRKERKTEKKKKNAVLKPLVVQQHEEYE